MSTDKLTKLERDWKAMIHIAHDFFHCWRQVVCENYNESAMEELTLKFWELVGKNTAALFTKNNIAPHNVEQIVKGIARSSEIMGETVRVEQEGDKWLLIHDDCPWINSYKKAGFPGKCQQGCDQWFKSTLAELSPKLSVETVSCLAGGSSQCIRKFSYQD